MVTDGIAERFLPVDMRDPDLVFEKSLAAIKVRSRRCALPSRSAVAHSCCSDMSAMQHHGGRSLTQRIQPIAAAGMRLSQAPQIQSPQNSVAAPAHLSALKAKADCWTPPRQASPASAASLLLP